MIEFHFVLQMEQDINEFLNDPTLQKKKFDPMANVHRTIMYVVLPYVCCLKEVPK